MLTLDLAPTVRIHEVVDSVDMVVAWVIAHELTPGVWCEGWVPRYPRDDNPRGWNTSTGSVEGGDLTLSSDLHSESIQCHTHSSFHGYVREGKWRPV